MICDADQRRKSNNEGPLSQSLRKRNVLPLQCPYFFPLH
jgi:hypothetical protein